MTEWISDRVTYEKLSAGVTTVFKSHVHLCRFKRCVNPLDIFWTVAEEWKHDETEPASRIGEWEDGLSSDRSLQYLNAMFTGILLRSHPRVNGLGLGNHQIERRRGTLTNLIKTMFPELKTGSDQTFQHDSTDMTLRVAVNIWVKYVRLIMHQSSVKKCHGEKRARYIFVVLLHRVTFFLLAIQILYFTRGSSMNAWYYLWAFCLLKAW